uniref:Uncharacterized protein n=1 Tax=Heterorhabditis bacteriophora TaxID=37862 RepID=A0A1I7XUE4_HETBA
MGRGDKQCVEQRDCRHRDGSNDSEGKQTDDKRTYKLRDAECSVAVTTMKFSHVYKRFGYMTYQEGIK